MGTRLEFVAALVAAAAVDDDDADEDIVGRLETGRLIPLKLSFVLAPVPLELLVVGRLLEAADEPDKDDELFLIAGPFVEPNCCAADDNEHTDKVVELAKLLRLADTSELDAATGRILSPQLGANELSSSFLVAFSLVVVLSPLLFEVILLVDFVSLWCRP